ncbi:hypothetical protein [Pseudomonas folii]|uniref:Bacterial Ig-like domain-containing protein n=1 Tax=Pseudomonas folii TaxID=2762593 RepID=A0ABR7B1B1_9PSED|nr:hypothetical protein [Pseudomonas folii]MBC3950978.1 hypothetical protein [Pseudomonas folii]
MNGQRTVSSITDVKDSKGNPVDNGESTDDPLLTVYGGGTASSVVFVYDNGDLLTTVSVTINRTWDFTDTFELGRHVFTVRDSLAGVDSPPWIVTVGEAAVRPEITRIEDSAGNLIVRGGTTEDDRVTVSGTAQADESVEIEDGTDGWGSVLATGGVWTKRLLGLELKDYSITARGRYGSEPVSAAWRFTVAEATLTIDSVKDAEGVEIPDGGTTVSSSVTLTGRANADQDVEILDDMSLLGTVRAAGGHWTLVLPSLAAKVYRIRARGLYGDNPESEVWTLTVQRVVGRENFESRPLGYLPMNIDVLFSDGLIGFFARVAAAPYIYQSDRVPALGQRTFLVPPRRSVIFKFGRPIIHFTFTSVGVNKPEHVMVFFDVNDEAVKIHYLPVTNDLNGYVAHIPLPKPCVRFELTVLDEGISDGGIGIDNFEWY